MPIRRRRLLAAVCAASASALAGCTGDDPIDRDPYGIDEPVAATATDEEGLEPPATSFVDDAHAIDLAVGDLTYALAPTGFRWDERPRTRNRIEVALAFGRTATAEHPATVRARIANRYPHEVPVELVDAPPFVRRATPERERTEGPGVVDGAPDRAGELVLVPIDAEGAAAATPDDSPAYERGPGGFWRVAADAEWTLPEEIELEANEGVDLSFALVGPAGSEGRPPGTYAVGGDDRVTVAAWPTGAPGVDPDSRFEGAPSLPDAGDATWYHEVDRSTPVYVEPAVERASAPADLAFDLINRSRGPVSAGRWHLYKLDDGAWHPVAPMGPSSSATAPAGSGLQPGRVRRWRLRAYAGDAPADDEAPFDGNGIDVPHLGGGRYALAVPSDRGPVAAAFDLEAPRLSLEPTGDLERRRDGDAVRVRSPAFEEARERWHLALEHDEGEDGDALLVESVYRDRLRGLRNVLAVALEEGADRVVLETGRTIALRAVGSASWHGNGLRSRVRFRGRTYELDAEPLEDADSND